MVVRYMWAAEPYSGWYTDAGGHEVIEDGFLYQPLGGTLTIGIAVSMFVAGAGLCGFGLSRRYRWLGGALAIVLAWCLWVALLMTLFTLISQLKLNPDVWGWWITLSEMFYEGAVAFGAIHALSALTASFAAVQLTRAGVKRLERRAGDFKGR